MKKKDSGVRKLSEIHDREGIVPFLLAIAKGADINEKVKGKPLVQFYYEDIKRSGNLKTELAQLRLKKLKCLMALGADMTKIIQEDYRDLVLGVNRYLMLLELLLENESAQAAIAKTGYRTAFLRGLQSALEHTSRVIADSGLIDDYIVAASEIPSPLNLWEEIAGEISEATGIEKLDIGEEDISYLRDWNEKLDLGLDLEGQSDENDGGQE